jgi:ABC-type cobalt transport system substrate-binding protein
MRKEEINYPALLILLALTLIFYMAVKVDKEQERKSSYDNTHEVIEQVEMEYYGNYIPILEI